MMLSFRVRRSCVAVLLLAVAVAAPARQAPAAAATTPAPPASAAPAPIPFAPADAAAVTVPSAPGAWGGPRTGQEATLSDRVVDYTIEATLDARRHAVSGKERMTWRNRSDREVRSIYLHLYLNAFQDEGSTFFTERKVLTAHSGSRGAAKLEKGQWGWIDLERVSQGDAALKWTFVHPDGGPATDQTVARVELAQPVPPGGTLVLDMDFLSQLPRVVERTGWWGDFNLVAQWFPKIGVLELPGERGATQVRWNVHAFHFNSEFYADFGRYDVTLDVPDGYTVGAVGEQQGAPVHAGGRVRYHFVQGDVHDFAWVAARGYKVLDGSWQGPGSPKVAVRVLYPPEYEASARPVLKASTDSLSWFSDTLGPYPYRTLTAVVPPYNAGEAGGMEYPTFFTAEGYREVVPGTLSQYALDFVTIHEFGHGYFYGLLASNEFEEPMLDEGLNEYWDQRMLRARGEDIRVTVPLLARLGFAPALPGFVMERMAAGLKLPYDPLGENAWDRFSSASYGTVYARTATAMHDLEERLGRDVTARAFREYYRRWHFRHPSIADLRQTLAEVSGKPAVVAQVFDQFVYGTARIDNRVASIDALEVLPPAGAGRAGDKHGDGDPKAYARRIDAQREAWRKTHPKARPGTGPFPWRSIVSVVRDGAPAPTTLRVTFADGSHQAVAWDGKRRWARFEFVRPVKAVAAELDPARTAFLDDNKLNDSRSTQPDGAASRRFGADLASLLQTLYATMVSL